MSKNPTPLVKRVGHVVTALAVCTDGIAVAIDGVAFTSKQKRAKWGDGTELVIRIEPLEEAKKHHQLKWFYGYIVKQCCAKTGYTVIEMDTIFRAEFLEPTVVTLSENTYEQMAEFNLNCERYAAEVIGVAIKGPDSARRWVA